MYLDLHEDGPASLRAIRTTGEEPAPNFVLDTSPDKNQVVWRVDGLDQARAESILRSLAAQFRGDTAATDISRVLRLPDSGTGNITSDTGDRNRTCSDKRSRPRPLRVRKLQSGYPVFGGEEFSELFWKTEPFPTTTVIRTYAQPIALVD